MKFIKTVIIIGFSLVLSGVSTLYAGQQKQGDISPHLKTGVYFFMSDREHRFFELKSDGTVIDDQGSTGTYEIQGSKLVNTYKGTNKYFIAGVSQKREFEYKITYDIKAGTLIWDNYYSYKLWKKGSTRENYASLNRLWLAIRPGSIVYDFMLDESGKVYFKGKFLYRFYSGEGMYVSPLSSSKRYRAVVSWDFDKGGIQLFIIDMKKGTIVASDGKAGGVGGYIPHWISWSPNERYALVSPGGEGVRELMYIDLKTKTAKDVPLKRFYKEYKKGIKEVQLTDINSVKWIDNQKYRVHISLYCNIYDDEKCNPNNPLRTYEAQVHTPTGKIDYKLSR